MRVMTAPGNVPGSKNWIYVVTRPGHQPIEGLAVALAAHPATAAVVGDPGELIERIENEDNRLHLAARMALHGRPDTDYLLVLVDQFEAEKTLRIPMRPDNRSLNLSNAVAVVLYEAWRQLDFGGGQ